MTKIPLIAAWILKLVFKTSRSRSLKFRTIWEKVLSSKPNSFCQVFKDCLKIQEEAEFHCLGLEIVVWLSRFSEGQSIPTWTISFLSGLFCEWHWFLCVFLCEIVDCCSKKKKKKLKFEWKEKLKRWVKEDTGFMWYCPPHSPSPVGMGGRRMGRRE